MCLNLSKDLQYIFRPLAKKLNQNEYIVWCLWLYHLLKSQPKDMLHDDEMMCDKSVIIRALRPTITELQPPPLEPIQLPTATGLQLPTEQALHMCSHVLHQCAKSTCNCIAYPSKCTYCDHFLATHAR